MRAAELLRNEELQEAVLDNIIQTMREKGFVGLDSAFEYIRAEDADNYFAFLGNASARLKEYGFFLHVDLAPKTFADQSGSLYEESEHVVWFEDARSIEAKLNLANTLGLRGAGYWNLMRPFAQNWALLNNQFTIARIH